MPLGGLITLAILLPNILWFTMPPREIPARESGKDSRLRRLEVIERIGQAGVILIPFFYHLPVLREASVDALAVMALALGFYYSGWVRYASKGRRFLLLFAPFLGVPLPMAVSPVIYYLAAAVFLGSWPLAAAAALLAVGHLPVSYYNWLLCRQDPLEQAFPLRRG